MERGQTFDEEENIIQLIVYEFNNEKSAYQDTK